MDRTGTDAIAALTLRLEAQDTLTLVFMLADRRDWDGLRRLLDEVVTIDYTSLNGGEPGDVRREDLLAAWRDGLGGWERTQHLLGSFVVDGVFDAEVRLRFYAIATHVLHAGHGASTWTLAGHYDAVLRRADDRFRLSALTLHVDWADGNQRLAALAAERGG